MINFWDHDFFFFFLHPPRFLPSSRCRRLENVCCCGQEQKAFHSSVERVQVSSLGLVVILSMEKDNNLDFFHSLFPICWCHEWSGLLSYRLPYQVRAVWGWKCCRQWKTRIHTSHARATPQKPRSSVITISPCFYIIASILLHILKECLWLLTLLHFWKFIMCLSGCVVVQ